MSGSFFTPCLPAGRRRLMPATLPHVAPHAHTPHAHAALSHATRNVPYGKAGKQDKKACPNGQA
jgi:hypothetical protein